MLTRAELLALVRPEPDAPRARAEPEPDAPRSRAEPEHRPRVRSVPAGDPLPTLTGLLTAEAEGAVPVLHDPDVPGDSLRHRLRLATASLDRAVTGGPTDPPGPAIPGGHTAVPGPVVAGPGSLLILPTSGSTAAPRLVVRTVRSWSDSLAPFSAVTGIEAGTTVWAPGPLSSTLTLFAVWHALCVAAPVVAGGRWRGVAAAGPAAATAQAVQCVPAVLADIVRARQAGLLPQLRTAVVAGAPLLPGLRRRAEATGLRVIEYYGAAELSFVALDIDGAGLRPFPGVEIHLRAPDPPGQRPPETGVGTVWVRSPYLARGYLDPADPGALRQDGDGWCTVGDVASRHPDGTLTLRGRPERALSVGGHVVLVADVEAVLGAVDTVAELVCLSEPDPRLGQRVVVAVRPLDGADPVPALRRTARERLPRPARPVRYVVLPELPRTRGGKPDRVALGIEVARTRDGGSHLRRERPAEGIAQGSDSPCPQALSGH